MRSSWDSVDLGRPSWGLHLAGRNRDYSLDAPWVMHAPGLALALKVMGFDTLRDILDPPLRGLR